MRAELQKDISETKAELQKNISEDKAELQKNISEDKEEFHKAINENRNEFRNAMREYKEVIKDITARLDNVEKLLVKHIDDAYKTITARRSPRQLTPVGRRLFEESRAEDILNVEEDKLMERLSHKLSELEAATALDVELYAIYVCLEASDRVTFVPMKNYIYNHPVYEDVNISLGALSTLMGLELRDRYLKLHPELVPAA
jgi:hypothetical protein